ncbi:MAG: lipid-A-disaccharide synthase [Odoribacteraceae bacterium]|jgi:lipid-A-disaccharide synthase|nr:lipid-A-disaccharide synthase [Odoribacteraceae bacterium]
MRYYVIAGEASGDLHASNLVRELKRQDPAATVRGWGGDLMREAGVDVVCHYKETAIMGFFTVVRKLGRIRENLRACARDILAWHPDVVVLVDYGGFNLRLAKMLKEKNVRVYYYISPKVWAWNTGRVRAIKRWVEKMYVIFPFEVDFYRAFNYTVYYAGNPLVDAIDRRECQEERFEEFVARHGLSGQPIIALLAGSRSQELKHVLPKMLRVTDRFPAYQFVIAGAPAMTEADYTPYLKGRSIPIVYGETYRLLRQARAALVTSGTATLETAILRVPQVVCYSGEGGVFFYLLFRLFVKVKFISLVNLIAGRAVVRELLMQQLNERNLYGALSLILPDTPARERILQGYDEVNRRLGEPGASGRVAAHIIRSLSGGEEG